MAKIEQLIGITKDGRHVDFSNIKAIAMVTSDSEDTLIIDLVRNATERKRQYLGDALLGDENEKILAESNHEVECLVRITNPKILNWFRKVRERNGRAAFNPTDAEFFELMW